MIDSHEKALDGQFARDGAPDFHEWQRLFARIDAGDGAGFVEFLTRDAQFRFGNVPAVQGTSAILAAVTDFFASIRSSQHRLLERWDGADFAACEGEVTYTRHDGSIVSYPFANVFKLRGGMIASYRIYIDVSTLFGPSA